jgi:hypothetical protein
MVAWQFWMLYWIEVLTPPRVYRDNVVYLADWRARRIGQASGLVRGPAA